MSLDTNHKIQRALLRLVLLHALAGALSCSWHVDLVAQLYALEAALDVYAWDVLTVGLYFHPELFTLEVRVSGPEVASVLVVVNRTGLHAAAVEACPPRLFAARALQSVRVRCVDDLRSPSYGRTLLDDELGQPMSNARSCDADGFRAYLIDTLAGAEGR
jgi:hypothetical protein